MTTLSTCPLETVGIGTWEIVAEDRVLQGAGSRGSVGTELSESLPNITGSAYNNDGNAITSYYPKKTGSFYGITNLGAIGWYSKPDSNNNDSYGFSLGFDASRSSSTYQDNAPVQPDAYLVNIFQRIS